jgi:hypothetical protein
MSSRLKHLSSNGETIGNEYYIDRHVVARPRTFARFYLRSDGGRIINISQGFCFHSYLESASLSLTARWVIIR